MSTFVEGNLEFTFHSPPWEARKWDDEPGYQLGIRLLPESKATDFIALRNETLLYLEVKDFRGYRIENKVRLAVGDLAVEVAQKVRDTIAGVVGACRVRTDGQTWIPFVDAGANLKRPVHVILWLEQDLAPRSPPGAMDQTRNTLEQNLKKQLRWLTTHVFVAGIDRTQRLADISVRNV